MHGGYLTGDIDRQPQLRALNLLSAGTAVSFERAASTGLNRYEGILWPRYHVGPIAWILSLGRQGRRHRLHGQQYCRRCLADDAVPYFRRRWRLACSVACSRHGIYLQDACPGCGAPVEYHAGDFGQRLLPATCQIVHCSQCGSDFRVSGVVGDLEVSERLLQWEETLSQLLRDGCARGLPGAADYSFLFFAGQRTLVQMLSSNSRPSRLRARAMADCGYLPFPAREFGRKTLFEETRLGDRALVLSFALRLLSDWPSRFVDACRRARLSSSYVTRYRLGDETDPFWLASIVRQYLFDRDYAPSDDEQVAAANYLRRRGAPVSRNAINRTLGVSSVGKKGPQRTQRWNPRGRQVIADSLH